MTKTSVLLVSQSVIKPLFSSMWVISIKSETLIIKDADLVATLLCFHFNLHESNIFPTNPIYFPPARWLSKTIHSIHLLLFQSLWHRTQWGPPVKVWPPPAPVSLPAWNFRDHIKSCHISPPEDIIIKCAHHKFHIRSTPPLSSTFPSTNQRDGRKLLGLNSSRK